MNIYVHIGYPKAASSTLQKHFFQKHPGINYLGLYPTKNVGPNPIDIDQTALFLTDDNLKRFYKEILSKAPDEYNHDYAAKLFVKGVKSNLSSTNVNLLSHEGFLASFFSYGDIKEKAERLKSFIPDAKIIMIIRNQLDLIKSQYRDWPFDPRDVRKGKPVSLENWISLAIKYDQQIGFMSSLQFDRVAKLYEKLFGLDNIRILCMESLAKGSDEFAKEISDFLEVDPNTTKELIKLKHENRAVSSGTNFLRSWMRRIPRLKKVGGLIGQKTKKRLLSYIEKSNKTEYIREESLRTFSELYAKSNQQLASRLTLPLDKHNYLM